MLELSAWIIQDSHFVPTSACSKSSCFSRRTAVIHTNGDNFYLIMIRIFNQKVTKRVYFLDTGLAPGPPECDNQRLLFLQQRFASNRCSGCALKSDIWKSLRCLRPHRKEGRQHQNDSYYQFLFHLFLLIQVQHQLYKHHY